MKLETSFVVSLMRRSKGKAGSFEIEKLVKLSRRINRIDVDECNRTLIQREVTRRERALTEAKKIAEGMGAEIYHQEDPRGAPLFLLFPGDVPKGAKVDLCYSNGIGVG